MVDNIPIESINEPEHEMGFHNKAQEVTKTKTSNGKSKPQIDVKELREYAALKYALKTIETVVDEMKNSVNAVALEAFLLAARSESIQGVDGDTTASLQLRKRTSRSALSDFEKETLDDLNIATEKSADSKVYINAKYADDDELADKVEEALKGIVPDDFLLSTGEKFVTTSDSLRQAMEIKDMKDRRTVVEMVSTQAARCKFGGSHAEMITILDGVLKS
ncbi:hypothetical protein LCGC14_1211370 [marine sediment metagenome]|uniref:Uncharacterized protein n=1 Tax=marine sediment metagenome TaxID=412755 RepID=A0A0F9PIH3_9ZZZZ